MSKVQIKLTYKGGGKVKDDADPGDSILFQNQTDSQRTIGFDQWPFNEAEGPIVVGAKDKSNEYTVAVASASQTFTYTIDPPLNNGGPPDEPSIHVGE